MNILGIDLGTNKTGITHISGDIASPQYDTKVISTDKNMNIDEKFIFIMQEVLSSIDSLAPELIVCEYPFNIQGNAKILVELFGVVHYRCIANNLNFLALPQTKIKKYATGSGSAEKSDIRMQAFKEFSLDLSEDAADSFFIAHFGMTWLYGTDKKFRQDSVDDMKKPKIKKSKKKK